MACWFRIFIFVVYIFIFLLLAVLPCYTLSYFLGQHDIYSRIMTVRGMGNFTTKDGMRSLSRIINLKLSYLFFLIFSATLFFLLLQKILIECLRIVTFFHLYNDKMMKGLFFSFLKACAPNCNYPQTLRTSV